MLFFLRPVILLIAIASLNACSNKNIINSTTSSQPRMFSVSSDNTKLYLLGASIGEQPEEVLSDWGFSIADMQEDNHYINADWLEDAKKQLSPEKYIDLVNEWNAMVPKIPVLANGKGMDRIPLQKDDSHYLAYFDHENNLTRMVITEELSDQVDTEQVLGSAIKPLTNLPGQDKLLSEMTNQLSQYGSFKKAIYVNEQWASIAGIIRNGKFTVRYSVVGSLKGLDESMNAIAGEIEQNLKLKYSVK